MLVIGADRTVLCRACVLRAYTSDFRSEYSLDKLYPPQQKGCDNNADLTKKSVPDIPVDRLSVSYCRSSGPGGQNVNKVNTKAEVRFHLASADWIAEDVRQKMAVMHKNKISRSGELIITSEVSRYQMRNLADCLQKLRDLIAEATEKPQVLSTEDVQVIRERLLPQSWVESPDQTLAKHRSIWFPGCITKSYFLIRARKASGGEN
uniref:Peptidyl-tRNA hydrolase ICT1, mitochondrial n=1 Tax=Sphaerodactylus townsendi TaxID=933632 RepID=A0ACB8EKJ7_9SAUR